jgi:predicted nucleic acid-binding protein
VIVADASAVVDFVARLRRYEAIEKRFLEAEDGVHAPHLVDVEAASALRRLTLQGVLSNELGAEAVKALRELPVVRYPQTPLLDRIWELRESLTAYDAAYVALAEALDAPLVTIDERLARSTGHRARIELVAA